MSREPCMLSPDATSQTGTSGRDADCPAPACAVPAGHSPAAFPPAQHPINWRI